MSAQHTPGPRCIFFRTGRCYWHCRCPSVAEATGSGFIRAQTRPGRWENVPVRDDDSGAKATGSAA